MTRDEVIEAIRDIIVSIQEDDEPLGALDHEVPLRDQIELDSMDFLDIVMELRKPTTSIRRWRRSSPRSASDPEGSARSTEFSTGSAGPGGSGTASVPS